MNFLKKSSIILICFVLLGSLCGCNTTTTESSEEYSDITVFGVTFKEAPVTAVSVSAATTEILLNLGYSDKLAAVSDDSILPEGVQKTMIGSADKIDFQKIISLVPNVVFSDRSLSKGVLDSLNAAGIKAVVIPPANTLRELQSYYSAVASIFLGEDSGITKADAVFKPVWHKLYTLKDVLGKDPLTFAYCVKFNEKSANTDTFEADVLSYLGTNVLTGSGYTFDFNAYASGNPYCILIASPFIADNLIADSSWNTLKAVQDLQVITVDESLFERRSLMAVDAVVEAAEKMYSGKADQLEAALNADQNSDLSDSSSSNSSDLSSSDATKTE